jgi:hypothetical protein
MPTTGTWGQVVVGMYVGDRTGKAWRVDRELAGWLALRSRDGEERRMPRPAPDAPVTILSPTIGEAVNTVEHVLGGTVIYQEV